MLRNGKVYNLLLETFYTNGELNLSRFYETHRDIPIARNTLYTQAHLIKRLDEILSQYLKDREIKKEIQVQISKLLFERGV